ncbi:MAG: APC family permease [Candidatus Baltobacteraceae bacterium]
MQAGGLRKALGPWSVVAFGVTNEIAAGLFFVSTQIQGTVPGAGDLVPWLMLAGGALTFLTVVAYRYFFASGLIGAGGEYVIVSRALHPAAGFLATFLAWFGVTAGMGALAYTAPKFLSNACSSIGWNAQAQFLSSNDGTLIAGLIMIWGVWLIHVRGVRIAGLLTVSAMCFVVAVAAAVIVTGFATTPTQFEAALSARLHVQAANVLAAAPVRHADAGIAFWKALPLLFFGYLGLSTATQTGGEAVNAQRSLATGVVIAVAIVTATYTAFTFAVYHAVPWQIVAGLAAMKQTAYTTATGLLGLVMPRWLASLMNLFVAVIVVKTFLPYFLAQSRWLYAWSSDGFIHGIFSRTHARYETPVLALTLSALLGSLSLVESVAFGGYVFGVSARVLSVMIVFFLMGLAMLLFPHCAPALYAQNTSAIARNRLAQILTGCSIMLFSLWFAVSVIVTSSAQSWYLQPALQSAAVLAAGAVIYARSVRRRSVPA